MAMKSEAQWQAESDARTLAEAERIKSDKKRSGSASKAATRMAVEAQKEATSMKKIAGKKPVKKAAVKKVVPKKAAPKAKAKGKK